MESATPSLREQGVQALRDGNVDGAIDFLARAVMADGQDAEAQAFLGVAYSQKGLQPQAKRALQTAVELRPEEARYQFNLGVALELANDVQGAAAAYQRVLQLNPEHQQARAKLQALGTQAAAAPAAPAPPRAPAAGPPAAEPVPWLAGGPGSPAATAGGPPGTVQCGQCKQWSKPGLSCEWCSAPLRSAPSGSSAPWLQSPGGAGPAANMGPAVSMAPDMSAGEAFGRRFAAVFIDSIILFVLNQVLILITGSNTPAMLGPNPNPQAVGMAFAGAFGRGFVIGLITTLTYSAGLLALRGQTLGKMALGIRVVGPDGNNPNYFRAALRETIGKWISGLIVCLGYLWMLWDEQQQTWHDKIAGTTVERT